MGGGLTVTHTLTRAQPDGWAGYARRIDGEMLAEVGLAAGERPARLRLRPDAVRRGRRDGARRRLGHEPQRIKTERFGPTGG